MKRIISLMVALISLLTFVSLSFAKDVYIKGYYKKDGTYVRPHVRSAPNQYKWDNYGPSRDDSQLMNPQSRDNDGDGVPNYLDKDDDNDGKADDQDSNQYGR